MRKATAMLYDTVATQAAVLSYLDIFVVLMLGSLIAATLAVFLKNIPLGKASPH
jgi:hypothetical protein